MLENIKSNSQTVIFVVKTAACFGGLLCAAFFFTTRASMQSGGGRAMSVNANMMNGNKMLANYIPTPEPPKSTIRGRVIYADTGGAVRRAGLMLMLSGSGERGGGMDNTGLTNERGEFEIKNVPAGRYFVSVNIPGVITPFSAMSGLGRMGAGLNSSESAVALKDFQEIVTNGVTDLEVTVTARRGAAISGRIIYADGESAIGVRVEILRKKNGEYSALVPNFSDMFGAIFGGGAGGLKTDDRGVFRISGLPAGEYFVRVVENVSHKDDSKNRENEMMALMGFNPSSLVATYYPNTDDIKKAETVKVELGQEYPEINLTIPSRNLQAVSGIVINKATRQPVKNARVNLKNKNAVQSMFGERGERSSGIQTDEQGRWSYKNLPTGDYLVTVEPPYDYDSPDELKSAKIKLPKFAGANKEITVEAKDLTDLVVELGYGATVSGTISYENQETLPSAVSLMLMEENGKYAESTTVYSENDGKSAPAKIREFKIDGVPSGKAFLRVDSRSYGEVEKQEFYVKSVLFNGKELANSPLETKEGEELKGVQIILSKNIGKLKGKVIKADKTSVGGATLSIIPIDKQKWDNPNAVIYTSTNGDGEFEISGAPGEYFIVFDKSDDATAAPEDDGKTVSEKRREFYEKQVANASKAMIKAKETETISLTLPD